MTADQWLVDLSLFVPGRPAPQGSKKAFVNHGRAVVVDMNKPTLRAWRSAVREDIIWWINEHAPGWEPLDEPVRIRLVFTLPRPVSLPKRVIWPAKTPDLDKLTRAVFDAITDAGWWRDDSRAVHVTAIKEYGARPGVHITAGRITTTGS